jgi:hypothetical protein
MRAFQPQPLRSVPLRSVEGVVSFEPSSAQAMDEVIQRCLDGDQAAWETIVRAHWRRVFNIAYKFVGRHDQARTSRRTSS